MKHKILSFLEKIKKAFSKKEKNLPSALQQEYLKIAPNIANIGFVSSVDPSKHQKEIFERIQPGDLVFCKMPMTDQALNRISEGHRERPYLIVQKNDHEMFGYACATHPKRLNSYEKHVFFNMVYDEEKGAYRNSYVQFNQAFVIPISHIRFFQEELDSYTVTQIARELKAFENIRNKGVLQFSRPVSLLEGDIVRYHKNYYYIRSISNNQYTVYPFSKDGIEFDMKELKFKPGNQIDINHPKTLTDLSIDCLVQLSNAKLNEQIRSCESKPIEKTPEKKNYHYIYPIGEILKNPINQDKYIYFMSYGDQAFGINYEYYRLHIYNLEPLHLNVLLDSNQKEGENQCISAYKKFIKEKNQHAGYFKTRLHIVLSKKDCLNPNKNPLSYQLDYDIGSILLNPFNGNEFIYLYSYGKSMYGLSFGKKKKFVQIPSNYLKKVDDVCEKDMIHLLQNAINSNTGKIQSILKELLNQYHQPSIEVNYTQKYPIGTILQCTFTDEEYMYLFTIGHENYGINLEDASYDNFDFSTIDLYAMKENGSLVIEDALFILYGVAQNTIRARIVHIIEDQVKHLNVLAKPSLCM